jgi:hypothetical protein
MNRPNHHRRPQERQRGGPAHQDRGFWEPVKARALALSASGLTRGEVMDAIGLEFGHTPHPSALTRWKHAPKPKRKPKPQPTYTPPRRLSDDERSAWRAFVVDELSRGARLRYGYRTHARDGARVSCPDYAGSAPTWYIDHGEATQDVPESVADAMLSDGAIRLMGSGTYALCTDHKRRKAA